MKIVFISNFLNHHQKPLSDELYHLTDGNYWFVATAPMGADRKRLGYEDVTAPYLITCYDEPKPNPEVLRIIDEADAVIIGSAPYSYIAHRNKLNRIVLKYTERLYKEEPSWLKLMVHWLRFKRQYDWHKNCHLLCASAYTAPDFKRIGCFVGRAYKWGYFPAVADIDLEKILEARQKDASRLKILWVARFLIWKHPEMPVVLAERLKQRGIDFEINMFGIGPEYDKIKGMICKKKLEDKVMLRGAVPNEEIIHQMRTHDICLFTSDRHEGWGAVANEAMGNGCVLVISDAIGCRPYLVDNGKNGLVFKSEDNDDLLEKTLLLVNNPQLRADMARAAYHTMRDVWSPANAAKSVIKLIDSLQRGEQPQIAAGPCSKA